MTQELERALAVEVLTMRRPAIIMIAMTLVAYAVLQFLIRRLEVEGKGNKLSGLFVGLGGRSLLHLSAAWCKFAFFASLLTSGQPAERTCYLLLLAFAAMTLLLGVNRLGMWLTEVTSAALCIAGLWIGTVLLNYLRQVRYDREIQLAYWILSVFMVLCAAAVLLREITFISAERDYFDESGETE
ncbi:MAG: hypothetical protein IJQ98_00545 [Oscillospiraceae bacterium]|nr:hypothetical protein [Oscillospiraceae bacterium]